MPDNQLRILCFGDSLTHGFSNYGLVQHPYSLVLQKRLEAELKGLDLDIKVRTNGVSGDLACNKPWRNRLEKELKSQNSAYDWVILLGGTNDLGYGLNGLEIWEYLETQYELCLSMGCRVLALAVPETAYRNPSFEATREELNARILEFDCPGYRSLDLKSKIPYHSLSDQDRNRYWDDGVHLTADGYDWMGGHIADKLIPIIREEQLQKRQPEQSAPKAQPKPKKVRALEDYTVLEEEGGSHNNLNEGYVVIRKKDLV